MRASLLQTRCQRASLATSGQFHLDVVTKAQRNVEHVTFAGNTPAMCSSVSEPSTKYIHAARRAHRSDQMDRKRAGSVKPIEQPARRR